MCVFYLISYKTGKIVSVGPSASVFVMYSGCTAGLKKLENRAFLGKERLEKLEKYKVFDNERLEKLDFFWGTHKWLQQSLLFIIGYLVIMDDSWTYIITEMHHFTVSFHLTT